MSNTGKSGKSVDMTKLYRLTQGTFGRHEEDGFRLYKAGEEVPLSDSEASARAHQIEPMPRGQYEPSVGTQTVPDDASNEGNKEGVQVGAPDGFTARASDANVNAAEKDKLESVLSGETSGAEAKTQPSPTSTTTENEWAFLSDLNVTEAADTINNLETAEDVQAAMKAEREGSNRKGVLKAGEAKLEELSKK